MKRLVVVLAGLAVMGGLAPAHPKTNAEAMMVHVKRITPVLLVEDVEPCLKFWTERMGFKNAGEVPDGNKLGFVMLQKDGTELMYQSFASQEKDNPATAHIARKGPTFLYIEVDKLDAIIEAMKGVEIVMPERKTFYGAREIGVKDPAGHIITFAEFAAPPQH